MVQLVLPNDANTLGNVLGGMVLHWIDLAAAVVAHRHCRSEAVTASIDQVSFLGPIRVGQVAMIAARMTYAGLFPGRGDGAVRVCAAGVGSAALRGYLRRAGWPGEAARVMDALGGADHGPVPGYAHLDARDGGAGPRLGVEVPLQRRAQLEGALRESAWVRALEGAAPEKVEALHTWPGWTAAVLPHQPWRSLLVRRVNHVKLVFQEGCAPQAKAYLAARHTPRPNRKGEEE